MSWWRRAVPPLFLLGVWLALWGEISVINVLGGVAVVAVVVVAFRRLSPRNHMLHAVGLARLLAVFVWRLITSSAVVVLTVIRPTPARLRSGVVGVELTGPSRLVAAVVADAISLTPGTLTLDVRDAPGDDAGALPPTLFIHVLGLDDPNVIRDDVRQLERLVLAAIEPEPLSDVAATAEPAAEEASS